MSLLELLDECARLGVRIQAEAGKLQIRAPAGTMTPALQEALKRHKAELLERLGRRQAEQAPLRRAVLEGDESPLSLVQQSLWFLNRMAPASLPAYNIRKALRLEGGLDVAAWEAALQTTVARRESLRGYFQAVDELPVAKIAPALNVTLDYADLSGWDEERREAELRRRLDEEGRRVFDLAQAPLFSAVLLRSGPQSWHFLLNAHHLIADALSAGLILQDMVAIYRQLIQGQAASLAEPAYQYSDFIVWQREQDFSPALDYWTRQLGQLPTLKLPTDRPAASGPAAYDGDSLPYVLPPAVAQALRAFSREAGVTLYTTLLASYAVLLHRFSGQADFPIGTSVAGRPRREWEDVTGFFANLIVLRMELDKAGSFRELVGKVEQTKLAGFAHQDVPFDLVVKAVRPQRSLGQNPLFQVLFLFLQSEVAQTALPGLAFSELPVPSTTAKFDLSLHVEDTGAEIRGLFEYKTALFEADSIRRLREGWLELLAAAMQDPARSIAELPLLGAAARAELIHGRNTRLPVTENHASLADRFAAQARRWPERVAVSLGGESLSYRELDCRANRLAHALRGLGVGPETRVGLLLPRSVEMVVALLAVLKAGGAYVPMEPKDPPARLAYILADSQVAVLVGDGESLSGFPSGSVPVLDLDSGWEAGLDAAIPPAGRVGSLNAAYVIYTSGSTGQPRGVVVSHRNVLRLMDATDAWFGFSEADVWTLFHSYAFDFSVWEIWGALLYGGRLVVVPHLTSRSPAEFHRLLAEEGVTVLNQTPSAFRSLVNLDVPPGLPPLALRYVVFGGEALDPAMLKPWFERHGDDQPKFVNMYGITETTVHVTWRPIPAELARGRAVSLIGQRIPDLGLYILDERLEPVPEGVTGELYVSGDGLARAYLGRPALTAERFIPHPFAAGGERLYRTGDLACWRLGPDIEYQGRCDHQVKIRGFRIELGEIESVLAQAEGVKECVVLAREDAPGQKRLVAYYVPDGQTPTDAAVLRGLCQARLPAHMLPAAFVALAAWPLTRNGKLDRDALPAPDLGAAAQPAYVAPRNSMERLVAEVWQQVLKVERAGAEDDFFALGGDSILILEVLSLLGKRGIQSSVAQLYRHQRLADLAEALAEETAAPAQASLPAFALLHEDDRALLPPGLVDAYPLSQLQAGMFFEEQLHPEQALYHDIFSFHLRLPLREAVWMEVLQAFVERHAVLRTAFDFGRYREPLQLVYGAAMAKCRFEDISALPGPEQECRVSAQVDAERRLPFDPKDPPLLRFYLLRRAEDRTQIIFGFHHAILDGWSVALMFSQLLQAYLAAVAGKPPAAWAPPALRYADFIGLERAALESEAERAYWRKTADSLPVTEVPRLPDAPGGGRRIEQQVVAFGADVSAGLQRLGQEAGAPLKTVALAAHLRVLGLLSGQSEVVTGLVVNGRPEGGGGEKLLGLFLNTLPLRLELGDGNAVEWLRRVFDAEREVLAHRRFPMATVKDLCGGRALFGTAFNFIHFHVYEEILRTAGVEALDHRVWEETDFPFLSQFSVYPGSGRLELTLIYDGSRFSAAQVEAIAGYYRRCLEAMAQAPEADLATHSLLSETELRQLEAWSGDGLSFPAEESLPAWFGRQVLATPGRVAVRFEGGSLSYAELDAASDALAGRLAAQGVGPGALVGLCVERSLGLPVAVLGILKAGAAYVPLDPAYPAGRLAFMLSDSGAGAVVCGAGQEGLARAALAESGSPARLLLLEGEGGGPAVQPFPQRSEAGPADAAYVIYTSGSTGQPKGVVVTHGNVVRLMKATEGLYGFGEDDVWTLFHSYAFDFSVWEIWGALLYGGTLVVVPHATSRNPAAFLKLLAEEKVTVLNQTPSAFYALMAEDEAEAQAGRGPALALRHVIFGGEALDLGRLRGWVGRRGDEAPRLVNMYGITETTVHVTYRRLRKADIEAGQGSLIGRPLPDLAVRVLDGQGRPVPAGVAGEMHVAGAGVARGYLNRPELTAERFLDGPGGRCYRSGDLARWTADGELEYLGRIDSQVKIRGFRIELGEIEQVLLGAGLAQAVALARQGPGGQPRLIAYGVAGPGGATARSLRQACEARLPDYMVPAAYVLLDALPLTANGKLDRDALPDPDAEALPQRPYLAPRDAVEAQLCQIWQQVLGLERVGVHDHFFELGGHSLNATQVVSRLREQFAIDLPLRSLFEEPTVENLARVVKAQQALAPQLADKITSMKRGRRQISLTGTSE